MRVIILSKAPVVGKVKTRLMPVYSAKQAAELHKQMINTVLRKTCSVFDDIWLAVDDINHVFFKDMAKLHSFKLCHQGQGHLGQRLNHLMLQSFDYDDEPIMFLGTDSPHVDVARYIQVQSSLSSHDMVIGPVEDGGYDLIAMNRFSPHVFDNINWGESDVFNKSMNNINELLAVIKVLDCSFDLDRPEDLERAPPQSW